MKHACMLCRGFAHFQRDVYFLDHQPRQVSLGQDGKDFALVRTVCPWDRPTAELRLLLVLACLGSALGLRTLRCGWCTRRVVLEAVVSLGDGCFTALRVV